MRRTAARALGTVGVALAVLWSAGCSPSSGPSSTHYRFQSVGAPLPATDPYVVMTGRTSGWAVWRTGDVWLLLHTADGFRHVTNRTPIAVPTEGGLVGSFTGAAAAVAVETAKRLLRSPVLTSTDHQTGWRPQELPSAVFDARGALASGFGSITAVTAHGRGSVVALHDGTWVHLTDAASLAPGGTFRIDSIVWADRSLGWITGHGATPGTTAYGTRDGGATWLPVPATDQSLAALAPCGSGADWLMPVAGAGGTISLFRTADGGHTWTAGAALRVAGGRPAWGCSGGEVWMVGNGGTNDHLFASPDRGSTWNDRGPVPAGLTDLDPTGGGSGVAVSGGSQPHIWMVGNDGSRFSPVSLPSWVASLGAGLPGD